jgi:glycosyltransferase involved in cell wall biosynthesis
MSTADLPCDTVVFVAAGVPPPGVVAAGGIARHTRALAEGLAARGLAVHIVSDRRPDGPRHAASNGVGYVFVDGVDVPRRPLGLRLPYSLYWPAFAMRAAAEVDRLVGRSRAIIDVTNFQAPGLALRRTSDRRVVVRVVTPSAFCGVGETARLSAGQALSLLLEGAVVVGADLVVYDSDFARARFGPRYGGGGRAVVTHLALPFRDGGPGTHEEPLDALHVGKLSLRKGTDVLFRAFARIVDELPVARLHLVGDESELSGPLHAAWDALPASARTRIVRHSIVDDDKLTQLRRRCALCVVPSRLESFGLPAVEAMADGVCVVAANAGALGEVVGLGDDAGGVLFTAGDDGELAARWLSLLSDPQRRRQFGERGRVRAEAHFSFSRFLERTLEDYRCAWAAR